MLGEMDLVNRQLDCEYDPCSDYGFFLATLFFLLTRLVLLQVLSLTSKQSKLALRSVWIMLLTTRQLVVSIFGLIGFERAHSLL